MGLSNVQTLYGIHSFTFFDRTTKLPYGILKAIGGVNVNFSGQFNDLYGGSSRYAWDSEAGVLDASISLNTKQFHNMLFERCLGASVTENAAETSGNVGSLTNQKGTSIVSATTGIASASAVSGSEADLKTGLYIVKAVTSTTVDVYCMSDVDFDVGQDKAFESDALKITATPLTITASGDIPVPGFGFQLEGGSGTIGMVAGDTAYVYVRKVNAGSDLITVGSSAASFSEFGCLWVAQKKTNGEVFEILVPKAKTIGLPLQLSEAAWANSETTIKALYDSAENAVFKIRRIKAAS